MDASVITGQMKRYRNGTSMLCQVRARRMEISLNKAKLDTWGQRTGYASLGTGTLPVEFSLSMVSPF